VRNIFIAITVISVLALCPAVLANNELNKKIDPTLGIKFDEKGTLLLNGHSTKTLAVSKHLDFNGKEQVTVHQNNDDISQRCFVEFTTPSLSRFKKSLTKGNRFTSHQVNGDKTSFQAKTVNHVQQIKSQQSQFIQQVQSQFAGVAIVRQFEKAMNSIVINADQKTINKIAQLPNVKRVTKEQRFHTSLTESVPLINAPAVWQSKDENGVLLEGEGVTVAIIDTGIDYTHPDLGGCLGEGCKVVAGWDFVNNDDDPMDGGGHGTHVAGIVAAESENYSGVAPKAKLYAIKVLSDEGWGTDTDIIAGIEYAVDPDGDPLTDDAVDIINMSLGGGGEPDSPLSVATDAAVDAGVIVVVAAGNDGSYGAINNTSPANAVKAITVASSTKSDQLSGFSSKALLEENVAMKPEITAPGSDINAPYLSHELSSLSGTSMASPHVAGAIALLKQAKPSLTAQQAKELLSASAIDLGLDPLAQGLGRIDILAALDVDTVIPEGMINFGILDETQETWSNDASFTIKNLTDNEQTYQLSVSDDFTNLAVLSLSETEVVVPAQSEVIIDVNITVADVINFPTSSQGGGIYHANIHVDNGSKAYRVPFAFQHATILTINNNTNAEVSVLIKSANGDFNEWPFLFPNGTTEIIVPNETLSVTSIYSLTASDFPDLLPEGSRGKGVTQELIEISGETEFTITGESLSEVIGVNSFKDLSGNDQAISDLSSGNYSFEIYGDWLHTSWMVSGGADYYFVLGDMFTDTKVNLHARYSYQDDVNPELSHFYNAYYEKGSEDYNNPLFDINLAVAPYFKFSFAPELTTHNNASLYVGDRFIRSYYQDIQPEAVFVYSSTDASQNRFFTDIGLYVSDSEMGNRLIASTGAISLNETGGLNQHAFWEDVILGTIPNTEHIVSANSTYWTGLMMFDQDSIAIHYQSDNSDSSLQSYIANPLRFNFGDLNSRYQFLCDNEPQEEASFYPGEFEALTFDIPELVCDDFAIEISYDNYLNNSKYRSSVRYSLNQETGGDFDHLKKIQLFEGDKQVLDQVIDKINPHLITEFTHIEYNEITLFLQLDGQEWQELNTYQIDNTLRADLDMVSGSHIANLKIETVRSGGVTATHRLNGFFTIGLSAGSENDVDDDGITNDLDTDNDNDGVSDEEDAFPFNSAETADFDNDGIGNNADTDDDNDGVSDANDAFPLDASEQFDFDEDGFGDNADLDDDNDGVDDANDLFPLNENEHEDTDLDGIGNNADSDDDNDFVADVDDAFPLDANEQYDFDGDGIGDNADLDDDNDSVNDEVDAFPFDATESADTDGDGLGNNADTDDDNDGVSDANDYYPLDSSRSQKPVTPTKSDKSGGGGSTGLIFIVLLSTLVMRKYKFYT
jgi:minor extracellular serine protease Vpr